MEDVLSLEATGDDFPDQNVAGKDTDSNNNASVATGQTETEPDVVTETINENREPEENKACKIPTHGAVTFIMEGLGQIFQRKHGNKREGYGCGQANRSFRMKGSEEIKV